MFTLVPKWVGFFFKSLSIAADWLARPLRLAASPPEGARVEKNETSRDELTGLPLT